MDTLHAPAVTELLARLFSESAASDDLLRERLGALSPEERVRRMTDPRSDYRELYGRAKDLYLAVSPETGRLLYLLARATNARAIVEYGTSFGISTIHLAAALRDNGHADARLVGSELEPGKAERARAHLAAAGLADLCDIRVGDAVETLARELPATLDLVLFDGFKPLYAKILDLVAPRLRPGAILVADNAAASPAYLARVRAPGGGFASVDFGGDVEVSVKV